MEYEYDGKKLKVNVIGGFQINEKKYAVCSFKDGETNPKIVIVQVIEEEDKTIAIDVPEEDKELVLKTYQTIKEELMEGENE